RHSHLRLRRKSKRICVRSRCIYFSARISLSGTYNACAVGSICTGPASTKLVSHWMSMQQKRPGSLQIASFASQACPVETPTPYEYPFYLLPAIYRPDAQKTLVHGFKVSLI